MSLLLLYIGIFLPTSLTLAYTPYLTRRTENFGVSIPESLYLRDDFKAMRKKYAGILTALSLLLTGILSILSFQLSEATMTILFTSLLFIFILVSFVCYLPFHYKMKKIKGSENWQATRTQTIIVDMKFRQEKLIYSNWWFLSSVIIIFITLLITFIFYNQIPSKLPIHTDLSGNITYENTSIKTLLLIPGTQIALLILFVFLNLVIKHTKQQVSVVNPERSKQQNIIFRKRWSAYLICTSGLTEVLFMYIQLTFIFPTINVYTDIVLFSYLLLILLGTLILAIFTGQGGSRIKLNKETLEQVIDRDDDQYWKLGQFYFNKDDPAIFIEKRFGVGWTNNWAHPLSWMAVIAILLVTIIPIILLQ